MNVFSIPLHDGKVTGKSRLNFSTFVDLLDSNVRYSLALSLMRAVGIKPFVTNGNIEFIVSSPPLFSNFKEWLVEKLNYEKIKESRVKVQTQDKISAITAETV